MEKHAHAHPTDLFVYGTLRAGAGSRLHRLLRQHADGLGAAVFQGKLFDVGAYPAAIPSPDPADGVLGEVYRLHPARAAHVLGVFDAYEDCDPDAPHQGEYRRERHPVTLADGRRLDAWIYLYNGPTAPLRPLPSGDYLAP